MTIDAVASRVKELLEKRQMIDTELRKLISKAAPVSGKRGRFIAYDKQAVLYDIVRGMKSAQQISQEHNITSGMVYTLKYNARKKNIIRDPVARVNDLDTTF
jgi:hypothetical protein